MQMQFRACLWGVFLSLAVCEHGIAQYAVGTVTGQYQTTATGAASYQIPLTLPVGAGGVRPELALTYSSQSAGGVAGIGWGLSGTTAISRCRSTSIHDDRIDPVDFDSLDRFCFGGSRLVVISGIYGAVGAEYRTEIDQFSKIISVGGSANNPGYFKVWLKNGDILYLGETSNSRFPASPTLSWNISKREDRYGNAINYLYSGSSYSDGSRDFMLSRVDYSQDSSGLPVYSVDFHYESSPKQLVAFRAGAAIRAGKRLVEIRVVNNFEPSTPILRSYHLEYKDDNSLKVSMLASVQECAGTGGCLPPTQFDWQVGQLNPSWTSKGGVSTFIGSNAGAWTDLDRIKVGDFNGDGFLDIYRVNGWNSAEIDTIYINDQHGNFPSHLEVDGLPTYVSSSRDFANIHIGRVRVVDINSDGYSDIYLFVQGSPGVDEVYLNDRQGGFLNYIDGASTSLNPSPGNSAHTLADLGRFRFADFNGDGFVDLLEIKGHYSAEPMKVHLNDEGQGFLPPYLGPSHYVYGVPSGARRDLIRVKVADFNADGLADIYIVMGSNSASFDRIILNDGNQGWLPEISGPSTYVKNHDDFGRADVNRIRLGDFNGDGATDIYVIEGTAATVKDTIYINDGEAGFVASRTIDGPATRVSSNGGDSRRYTLSINRIKTIDYNSDGLIDVYVVNGSGASQADSIYLNQGNGDWALFSGPTTFVEFNSGEPYFEDLDEALVDVSRTIFSDFTGDGLLDLYFVKGWNSQTTDTLYVQEDFPVSALNIITNGLGEELHIDYGMLTDPNIYTKGCDLEANPGGLHVKNVVVPFSVVKSKYVQLEASSMTQAASYRYAGLCDDVGGRGSLGFESMETTDPLSGRREIEQRFQEFPLTGRRKALRIEILNGDPIRVDKSFPTMLPLEGSGNPRYSMYELIKTSEYYELGDPSSPYKSKRSVDTWGESTSVSEDRSQGNLTSSLTYYFDGALASWSSTLDEIHNVYYPVDHEWMIGRLKDTVVYAWNEGLVVTRESGFSYNDEGSVEAEVIEPGSGKYALTTSYSYDSFGNVLSKTLSGSDVSSRVSSYSYSADGRFMESETNALGHTTNFSYDARTGYRVETIDPNGVATQRLTDDYGRVFYEMAADGQESHAYWSWCHYSECNNPNAVFVIHRYVLADIDGNTAFLSSSYEEFDEHERTVATRVMVHDGLWSISETTYDAVGRVSAETLPYFFGDTKFYKSYEYDAFGRLEKETSPASEYDPDGAMYTTEYDGLQRTITDPHYRTRSITEDLRGAVTYAVDVSGGTVDHFVDAYGNIWATLVNGDNAIYYSYDRRGRLRSLADPSLGSWSYEYNVFGEVISQNDGKRQVSTFQYDDLGRLVRRDTSDTRQIWNYDVTKLGALHREKMLDKVGSSTQLRYRVIYAYDSLVRLKRAEHWIDGQVLKKTFAYDAASGLLETVGYPNNYSVNFVHDAEFGFLESAIDSDGAVLWRALNADARGNTTELKIGPADVFRYYDHATGSLSGVIAGNAIAPHQFQSLAYTWDEVGNLISRVDHNQGGLTETFDYDQLDRVNGSYLSNVSGVPGDHANLAVEYASNGNITEKSAVGDYYYDHSSNPYALTQVSGPRGSSYIYDDNGAVIFGSGLTVEWSSLNKPTRIRRDNSSSYWQSEFLYDANNRRVRRIDTNDPDGDGNPAVTTTYYLDSDYERSITNGVTTHKYYIRVGGELVAARKKTSTGASTVNYLLTDHLGSVDTVIDGAGTVLERLSYDAFGKRRKNPDWLDDPSDTLLLADQIVSRGYTGHEHLDGLNVVHMNGRVYDPVAGRFLSPDPIVQDPHNTQSYNRYSYVFNNPLKYTDPSGYSAWSKIENALNDFESSFRHELRRDDSALSSIVQAAIYIGSAYCNAAAPACAAAGNALLARAQGAPDDQAFQAGVVAAITYDISYGNNGLNEVERAVVSGAIAGSYAAANGGEFGHAFAATVVSGGVGKVTSGLDPGAQFFLSVVAGGTISEATGGKFANGAVTAAFAYALRSGMANRGQQQSQSSANQPSNRFVRGALDVVGKIWALPNTVLGLVAGGLGYGAGWVGYGLGLTAMAPGISFRNNAIQFHNIPSPFGGALTLGNTIIYSGGAQPGDMGHWYGDARLLNLGLHERGHTYQAQAYGLFFLPAYFLSGGVSGSNAFEQSANDYAAGGDWRP